MDGMNYKVTLRELKTFHRLDRNLYTILVRDLTRNPHECLQIMGFWLWLECAGFTNFIGKILALQHIMINEACNEALTCLSILFDTEPSTPSQIPLTNHLMNMDHLMNMPLSLTYFRENRIAIFDRVQKIVRDVYIPALSDILEQACLGEFSRSSAQNQSTVFVDVPSTSMQSGYTSQVQALTYEDMISRSFSGMSLGGDVGTSGAHQPSTQLSRTMFVTFSKGYPVMERELRELFRRMFGGDCIESLTMQEVGPDEQSLFARIIFVSPAHVQYILNGETKVKFTINGRHVWMREFVPRSGRVWPCVWPDNGARGMPPLSE